jgi:c-di-GMP-binding flagellar brake protein YcgR
MKKEETEPRSGAVNFERRKHPRFSIDLPIEYWQLDRSKSRPGRTIDVSEGGLLLDLPESMEIGQVLGLTLFITSGPDLNSIEALTQVQVVWKDTHGGKDGGYRVGVKFIEISPEDMGKLKNLLKNLLNLKASSG